MKRRFLSLLLAALLLCSLCVSSLASDENYTASLRANTGVVAIGETVSVSLVASCSSSSQFASSHIRLSYNPAKLTYVGTTGLGEQGIVRNDEANKVLIIADAGASKPLGSVYTVTFTAKAGGTCTISLTGAAFSTSEGAELENLHAAALTAGETAVPVTICYPVTLSEGFTGPATARPNEDYTFSLADDAEFYDYGPITVIVSGFGGEYIDNGNGTYTVEDVAGPLEIQAARTPKSYNVRFASSTGVTLPPNGSAVYGTDYSFTLPTEAHYAVSVESVTVGGSSYTGYAMQDGKLTIPGSAVRGDIVINLKRTLTDTAVTLTGNAAGEVSSFAEYAVPGQDYTLQITEDSRYTYAVTAAVNGTPVKLRNNGGGSYTISGADIVLGKVELHITKTVKAGTIGVSEYLTLDGGAMWLITVTGTGSRLSGTTFVCQGVPMFWSEKYAAYCCLTVSDAKTAPVVTETDLAIRESNTAAVVYNQDVNMTGITDVNDAQLVYRMYNVQYSGFTDSVPMEKFLRADVNGDKVINTADAAAIMAAVIG